MASSTILRRVGFIGAKGAVVPRSDHYLPVLNPATGETIGEAYEVQADDLDEIVEQARTVYESTWRTTAPDVRGELVRAWADLVRAHRDELADLEVADVGNLRAETMGDVDACVRVLTYYAGMADKLEGRSYAPYPGRVAYGVNEPYGVVAGINPYNANAVFVAYKAGPAVVAGNCIVLKAPDVAPLSTFRIVELALKAGIPPGVVNVVTGRGQVTGPLLTQHPGIGLVAFTGGPEAGRAVIRQSARNIVPVSLELGGKSPAILLKDADLRLALPSVLHSNFVKSGQSCVAGSRIFVHGSMYAQVCDELASRAAAVKVGQPTNPASQMGTLITQRHRDHVDVLVQGAISHGATCLAGGAPVTTGDLEGGAFYAPTVLVDVTDDNPAATTEAFGPMASVLPYTDVDEALFRANSSPFGLSAQVWGNDASQIQHLVQNLSAGTVWVNAYRAIHPTVPFGGMKESGYGRENGFEALRLYTQSKAVVWDLSTERPLPYT
ncbi:aldehyde dehydrogenase family protein [Pseudofrankia sp. BMG5.37]|uniref:aldehyde dehydrogenase family protein n=1 Tax=Pseudofrankia sp. BMG5.37 TaxID=3050035 RepID=UPI002895C88C|nr:aldehyde dehydrogenase family protein [Pseudofrankia sp. BMG5.37]MDT3444943.1 aldehyde dehydrogenase family protein [Pseudofrankia sp. BMG5.37]